MYIGQKRCLLLGDDGNFALRLQKAVFDHYLSIHSAFICDVDAATRLLMGAPTRHIDAVVLHAAGEAGPWLNLLKSLQDQHPDFPVMVCSPDKNTLGSALSLGAKVCLPLPCADEDLADALKHLVQGDILIAASPSPDKAPEVSTVKSHESVNGSGIGRLATAKPEMTADPNAVRAGLTAREQQIAALLKSGLSVKEVAQELQVSPATVATHVRNAYQKLGVHSRPQLRKIL